MKAAREYRVRSPLLEAGLGKEAVRTVGRLLGLPNWDKPAAACLSSRIARGELITLDRLKRVEEAEAYLLHEGFRQVRVRDYSGRIMNVHPALLPAFSGLHAQRQALEHGARVSGATVHFVDEGLDSGPIILQAAVPVHEDDTEETLSKRILEEEHRLYPEAISLYFGNRLRIEGRRVRITGR